MKINKLVAEEIVPEVNNESSIIMWLYTDEKIINHILIDKKTGDIMSIGDRIMRPNVTGDAF